MKRFVAFCVRRAAALLIVMFFVVCARAEAQCGYLMFNEFPDPDGYVSCMESYYGPPTEEEQVMLEMILQAQSLYEYLLNGPLNEWSWQDFYGCAAALSAGSAFGNVVIYIGGAAVTGGGFVAATAGIFFGCAMNEINWYW